MQRADSIVVYIPNSTEQQTLDNGNLFELFQQLSNCNMVGDQLILSGGAKLQPKLVINKNRSSLPSISFEIPEAQPRVWQAGDLRFGLNLPDADKGQWHTKIANRKQISIDDLLKRFGGKVTEINHAGLNIGPTLLSKKEYLKFKAIVAEKTNMYDYPTGQEWPFIIASTHDEFLNGIRDLDLKRNPKFEIVHDSYNKVPLLQFDIVTSLTKAEIFRLLPDPVGISYEGLEDAFRTVFVSVDWGQILLRFDFGFRSSDFTNWLLTAGKRVEPCVKSESFEDNTV